MGDHDAVAFGCACVPRFARFVFALEALCALAVGPALVTLFAGGAVIATPRLADWLIWELGCALFVLVAARVLWDA